MDKGNVVRVNFRPEAERSTLDAKSLWLRDILDAMPFPQQTAGMMLDAVHTGEAVRVSFNGYDLVCDRVKLIEPLNEKSPTPSKEPGQ